jgi:hypothetical protein
MKKFFASYEWAYGREHRLEEFANANDVLALVKKAHEEDSVYRQFVVIYGEKLEFEPCEIVQSFRIKESCNNS